MNGHLVVVLDASALLATVLREPGGNVVRRAVPQAVISSVNWSEVVQKTLASGSTVEGLREEFEGLGMRIEPLTTEDAEQAALLWPKVRSHGLSLADRACLALASRLHAPALTTDHAWEELEIGVEVRVIR